MSFRALVLGLLPSLVLLMVLLTGCPADAPDAPHLSSAQRLLLPSDDEATRAMLDGAVLREISYGSYRLLFVDLAAAGGRAALEALPVELRDGDDLVRLNGYTIDARAPEATWALLPAGLKKDRLGRARAGLVPPVAGLYLVQMVGPIQPEWRAQLAEDGLQIVHYVPENAFVVRASEESAPAMLERLRAHDFIQLTADYEPAFKIAPPLRNLQEGRALEVLVQLIEGPEADRALAVLTTISGSAPLSEEHSVLGYRNVRLRVDSARVGELALLDEVFAVEPAPTKRRLDEAQGQIVAGNLTGTQPSGPGYLAWLTARGFAASGTQFASFAVNVVDDTHAITGHPDLPSTRVVFQNNPSGATGTQSGHGFLNTNIVAGSDGNSGTAYEDSRGYRYGLGIAPFARVGATDVFGNGNASPTSWENAGYAASARISTNSWGNIRDYVYDAEAQQYDAIVRDAQSTVAGNQSLIVVFAAGNDGPGADTVSSPGTAKNVLTVGASENVRQTGLDGCGVDNTGADSAADLIDFSSRGPVNAAGGDGRTKPDIVAPGTHVQAGIPQSNYDGSGVCDQYWPAGQTLYAWSSGTSHATPAVAGGSALVYQWFLNHALTAPSPAMTKAFLMSSAAYMTGVGTNDTLPSNNQGMGRMDLGRAFDGVPRMLIDGTQLFTATGQSYVLTGSIAQSTSPFRVTLAWSDAPGPTSGAPWVNNLDLTVAVGGKTYKGNVFSGANSIVGGSADAKNNVESVFLPAGTKGAFTATVRATNIAGDGVPGNASATDQDFALVAYNANPTATTPPPMFGLTPVSLAFSGPSGGPNPAVQALAVANTGAGTLSWTVSSNATWLVPNALQGTAPSRLLVSVNVTHLAPGTYTGALAFSAPGAAPRTVPVSLTVGPPAPTFVMACVPSSISVALGSSGAATCTVSSRNGFTGTVSLSTPGLAVGLSTSLQPISVTLTANGSATTKLTVSAASTTATGNHVFSLLGSSGALRHAIAEIAAVH
jgi:hypothetical protein